MQRNWRGLIGRTHDLLVVGGGITGACIARDAARRGLAVALVERDEFSGATSAATSKLVHGGLRYLRQRQFGMVRESLAERHIWARVASALVRPLPFVLPSGLGGRRDRLLLGAGLLAYDLLAFDRNWSLPAADRLPRRRRLDRREAVRLAPALDGAEFDGAYLYGEYQMAAPAEIAVACLRDAAAHGAEVVNHVTMAQALQAAGAVCGAVLCDRDGNQSGEVRARAVVNATGPWAGRLADAVLGRKSAAQVALSKGIHLLVRGAPPAALSVALKGAHFFLLPWRDHTIIGTTDTPYDGDLHDIKADEAEIAGLLATVNAALPGARVARADVVQTYAGVRPLTDGGESSSYTASRRSDVIAHARADGLAGFYSAIGGKWTTARALAARTVDAVVADLGLRARPCDTHRVPLPASIEAGP
jgi:glycerol-3-phosphate dehydrogenase